MKFAKLRDCPTVQNIVLQLLLGNGADLISGDSEMYTSAAAAACRWTSGQFSPARLSPDRIRQPTMSRLNEPIDQQAV